MADDFERAFASLLLMILFTMPFSGGTGGMIPTFLVVKETGLMNSLWALVIPSAASAFNILVMREFFESWRSTSLRGWPWDRLKGRLQEARLKELRR